jgi:hypothetical protein
MLASLKQIIENSDTRAGRTFDLAIQGLILVSLIAFSLETLPDLSPTAKKCRVGCAHHHCERRPTTTSSHVAGTASADASPSCHNEA